LTLKDDEDTYVHQFDKDELEEKQYPLFDLSKDIHKILESRFKTENISYKDLNLEQIAIKLDANISQLPLLLRQDYYKAKSNCLNVITDLYCYLSQLEHKEKTK